MDRIELKVEIEPIEERTYKKFDFMVNPYMTLENQLAIAETYIETLFEERESKGIDYLAAEYALMLATVELCTNISIDKENISNLLVGSGLWEYIQNSIKNYGEFRVYLETTVRFIVDKRSAGAALQKIAEQITGLINNVSQIDFSENGITALTDKFTSLQEGIGELNKTLGNNQKVQKPRSRHKKTVEDNGKQEV